VEAILTPYQDNLLQAARRIEALIVFIQTAEGKNLLAGTKRAVNILAAEEQNGLNIEAICLDPSLFTMPQEQTLFTALEQVKDQTQAYLAAGDFSAALKALSSLRTSVDDFFEHVLVNDEDAKIRANRLGLLAQIRAITAPLADFSKLVI